MCIRDRLLVTNRISTLLSMFSIVLPKTELFISLIRFFMNSFLANVNSRSRSLYAIARPSVRRLSVCRLSSVTLVRPTQAVQIFGNISTALGTLAICSHPLKISRRSSQGNPSAGRVKHKRGSKNIAILDLSTAIYRKRCKIGGKLVLITNR